MNRHSPSRTAREQWKQRYISALISALGAATILNRAEDCKTLHALSSEATGLTIPEKSDTMRSGTTPGTEGNAMKKYAVYTHYDDNKTIIGYIIPQFDGEIAFITKRTYDELLKKRTIGGNAGIYSDYPGEIRITNNEKTEYIGYMQ